jgi:hypothetical protein
VLIRLREWKEDFILYDSNLYANIANCFKRKVNETEMISSLRLLAEHGSAPLKNRDDPIAEAISLNNVGGVVPKFALNIGLPKSVWKQGSKFGLIPASHTTRLVTAEYLII